MPSGNADRTADTLVIFGITGDLAHKKLYAALAALEAAGKLEVPVVGVASSAWDDDKLRAEVLTFVQGLLDRGLLQAAP